MSRAWPVWSASSVAYGSVLPRSSSAMRRVARPWQRAAGSVTTSMMANFGASTRWAGASLRQQGEEHHVRRAFEHARAVGRTGVASSLLQRTSDDGGNRPSRRGKVDLEY